MKNKYKLIDKLCGLRSIRKVMHKAVATTLVMGFAGATFAATPKDTLVVAMAFDDIITMDPAESFEISAGEVMGNTYDRLLRLNINDPSKLVADVAKTWNVSADGKTYTFEIKPGNYNEQITIAFMATP